MKSKSLFLMYEEKYQKAIKESYLDAFNIILAGIKRADVKNDRELRKSMIFLIKSLYLSILAKYGMMGMNHLGT